MRAVYPGSFDPVTYGHLDIIERAASFMDELIVAVLVNGEKRGMFTRQERLDMLRETTAGLPNVRVEAFEGLLANFARERGVRLLVRGLRALSDFEYEFQMALTNRSLNDRLETLLIPTSAKYLYISSSILKEVALMGGDVDEMAPPAVRERLAQKAKEKKADGGTAT